MGSLIRICAVLAAGLVALSFAAFVVDQANQGSEQQVNTVRQDMNAATAAPVSESAVDTPAPPAVVERAREARHGTTREAIDDANDVLVTPFAGLTRGQGVWVQRLASTALALLAFGLGGLWLANLAPRRARTTTDWREAST